MADFRPPRRVSRILCSSPPPNTTSPNPAPPQHTGPRAPIPSNLHQLAYPNQNTHLIDLDSRIAIPAQVNRHGLRPTLRVALLRGHKDARPLCQHKRHALQRLVLLEASWTGQHGPCRLWRARGTEANAAAYICACSDAVPPRAGCEPVESVD